jgi:hypothetical protein
MTTINAKAAKAAKNSFWESIFAFACFAVFALIVV